MYFLTRQFWLAAAVAFALTLSSPLVGQTVEKGPVRTVLALGRVASMIETPIYFKLSRVTIPAAATVVYRGDHSMIYLLSGALTATAANDKRALQQGEGTYLPPGIELTLQAGQVQ
jgi:quercetin dioxygenase-like cupin family protein